VRCTWKTDEGVLRLAAVDALHHHDHDHGGPAIWALEDSLSMSDSARLPRRIHQSFPVHRYPDLMRRALRYTHADVVRLRAYESNQFVCRLVANQKHPPTYSLALRFVFRYDRRPLVGRVTGFQRTTTSRYVLRWSTVPVYRQCRST